MKMKKDIKWLKAEVEKQDIVMGKGHIYTDDLIYLIDQLDEPEVLTQEWIEFNTWTNHYVGDPFVYVDDLQNLLVPKQEEITEEQAWQFIADNYSQDGSYWWEVKNHYESLTDKVVIEKPTIPQFVAEWIEEMKEDERPLYSVMSSLMNKTNHEWAVWKSANKNFSEIVAQAWVDGYTVEKEQKYYARIKGWENVTTGSEAFNWVYFKEKDTVGISKAVENKYQAVSFTKYDWKNLGINEDNADFVLVEVAE